MERKKPQQQTFIKEDFHESPLLPDLRGVVHPYTELWLVREQAAGNLGDYIDGLKRAGLADDMYGVIRYTEENLRAIKNLELPIPRVDAISTPHWRRLKNILQTREGSSDDTRLYGLHGTTSHYAVRELMRGLLPDNSHGRTGGAPRQASFALSGEMNQSQWVQIPGDFFSVRSIVEPVEDFSDEIFSDRSISDNLLSYIECHRDCAQDALQNRDYWTARQQVEPLYAALLPIFGTYASRLKAQRGERAQQLLLPTFLNWANAVLRYHDPSVKRLIFPELPVLERNTEAKSGRVDALEIVSKQKGPLSEQEREIIKRISQERFSSIITAVTEVEAMLGDQVTCRILEYKFDVGDHKKRSQIIQPGDIEEGPVHADKAQLENYLTFASLAECGLDPDLPRSTWPQSTRFTEGGDISYWLHGEKDPREFHVWLSPEEQGEVFHKQYIARLDNAREKLIMNLLTHVNVGGLTSILEGRKVRSFYMNGNGSTVSKNQMKFVDTQPYDVGQVIRDKADTRRIYVDRYGGIVEWMGETRGGKPDMRLNYSSLLEAIQSGQIDADYYFNPTTGGKVACVMKDHEDSTPSMMIYLDKGVFHCYGCQAHGRISQSTLPLDIAVNVRKNAIDRKGRGTIHKEIPQELYQVMTFAQELLRYSFPGSPAEVYLKNVRGIDSDTAAQLGVGYCDERFFIKTLLDEGFPIELLKKYGLVTIGRESGRVYSMLNGRATFPLADGIGLVNNFYGRAIRESKTEKTKEAKRAKHRKLSTNGYSHGVFNAEVLESAEEDEVIVVEGCIDALSLQQMHYPNVVAIVGTGNEYGIQRIADSGKNIALALDNDEEGQKAANRIAELLYNKDFNGRVRNFTYDFIQEHPEAGEYDDYNSFWVSQFGTGNEDTILTERKDLY